MGERRRMVRTAETSGAPSSQDSEPSSPARQPASQRAPWLARQPEEVPLYADPTKGLLGFHVDFIKLLFKKLGLPRTS